MSEVVPNTQNEFWRPPAIVQQSATVIETIPSSSAAEVCPGCTCEFVVGARYCHTCGCARPDSLGTHQSWTRYLEFHTIMQEALNFRRYLQLPLASLICFLVGLLCLLIAFMVGLVYPIENLTDFQAVQLWRIQWVLGGVAAFVAGILLKRPSPPQK
jgi:hypothetical protein